MNELKYSGTNRRRFAEPALEGTEGLRVTTLSAVSFSAQRALLNTYVGSARNAKREPTPALRATSPCKQGEDSGLGKL